MIPKKESPNARTRHTELLERELQATHQSFTRIQGPFEQRFQQAATVIESVLRMPVRPRFVRNDP